MSPWLCSCRDARRIASCHNISRFRIPAKLTAGTKLESYRASGLVRRPTAAGQRFQKQTFHLAELVAQMRFDQIVHDHAIDWGVVTPPRLVRLASVRRG